MLPEKGTYQLNSPLPLPLHPKKRRKKNDSSKLEEFADGNFKFDKNVGNFSEMVENTVGKGEIAGYEQFLLFPQCFQKTSTSNT